MNHMKTKMIFVVLVAAPIALNAGWLSNLGKKATAPAADTARRFVLCDPLLRTPAIIYSL